MDAFKKIPTSYYIYLALLLISSAAYFVIYGSNGETKQPAVDAALITPEAAPPAPPTETTPPPAEMPAETPVATPVATSVATSTPRNTPPKLDSFTGLEQESEEIDELKNLLDPAHL